MDTLYTIAVPALDDEDVRVIDAIRAQHDAAGRALLPPHFTLLFGCSEVPQREYLAHVSAVAARHTAFDFVCRHAMVFPGTSDRDTHVFLVPQEGLAPIHRLHDELYTGPLEPFLRLDIPFIPHITVASGHTQAQAQALSRELNDGHLRVHGKVETVIVGALRKQAFIELAAIGLRQAPG